MKKAIAILFLTAYLFSTTELSQLLKLPMLVNHFNEHKEQDKNLTLLGFLAIHYAHGDVKDADYDKDMKLPFKTHDGCTVQINVTVPPSSILLATKKITATSKHKIYIHTDVSITSAYLSAIWQPPKFC